MAVQFDNYAYVYCFYGTGYLGVSIPNVDDVYTSVDVTWFRWYNAHSGYFCTITSHWGFGGAVSITQVDPGYSHYPSTC